MRREDDASIKYHLHARNIVHSTVPCSYRPNSLYIGLLEMFVNEVGTEHSKK